MLQVCLQTQFYMENKMSVSKWSVLNFGRHKNKSLPQYATQPIFSGPMIPLFFNCEDIPRLEVSPTKRVISKFQSPMANIGASYMTMSRLARTNFGALH